MRVFFLSFWAPGLVFLALLFALGFWFFLPQLVQPFLTVVVILGLLPSAYQLVRGLFQGRIGVDVIALSSMVVAVLVGQPLAGAIILLMFLGGEGLESYALRRARRELEKLLSRAPTMAHLKKGNEIVDVPVEAVAPDDVCMIKPGELVPVDAIILRGSSSVDQSMLTGEPLPVDKSAHGRVLAGSINQSGLLEARALAGSSDSQYGRMVRLIREAESKRAPMVRLADRWSGWFTLATFALAGGAWILSQDPLRALAVLVVATPCPLILATPIAILSGMSWAAGRGIIIKHGGALEALSRIRSCVFDKTGTLTFGTPHIRKVVGFLTSPEETLKLAASLDQGSTHVLSQALVAYAKQKNTPVVFPDRFEERVGHGVRGVIGHRLYAFGKMAFLKEWGVEIPPSVHVAHEKDREQGIRAVYLGSGKKLLGWIEFADEPRPGLKPFLEKMRKQGVKEIAILTGDKIGVAKTLARALGIKHVHAECLPEEKVSEVERLRKQKPPVAMVGDGINDAPALAAADVGIALGAHGASVSSEAADVVITVDDVTRVYDAFKIAKRSIRVAYEGIILGMGLSVALMSLAVVGWIRPMEGAFLQEIIDVIVIFHAVKVRVKI